MSLLEQNGRGRRRVVKVRVSDAEFEFLKTVADIDDRTLSYVLRRALREYHERHADAYGAVASGLR